MGDGMVEARMTGNAMVDEPVVNDRTAREAGTAFRTHRAGELTHADIGHTVRLGGWIHRKRDLGGVLFLDLRDRAGLVQLSFDPRWTSAEVMAQAAAVGLIAR